MSKELLKNSIQRYITLVNERRQIDKMLLPFELKEECKKHYNREIEIIMNDPYLYDKIMGLIQGDGIV